MQVVFKKSKVRSPNNNDFHTFTVTNACKEGHHLFQRSHTLYWR